MRQAHHRITLMFLCVFFFQVAKAIGPKEKIRITGVISYVEDSEDALMLYVDSSPFFITIVQDSSKVLQKFVSGDEGNVMDFGSAMFVANNDGELGFSYKKTQSKSLPEPGDLIRYTIEIDALPYKGILFELATNQISFMTVEEEYIYAMEDVLLASSPSMEADVLQSMVEDIRYTAVEMRKQMDPVKITGGIYDGKELFNVMEAVTADEVLTFLKYVRLRPRKYMGTVWKISEVFATWVASKTPMPLETFKQIIPAATTLEEFETLVNTLSKDALEEITSDWNAEAEKLAREGKFQEAYDKIDISMRAAIIHHHDERLAWAYFAKANILSREKKKKEGIESMEEAEKLFHRLDRRIAESFALSNKAMILEELREYKKAEVAFKKSISIQQDFLYATESSEDMFNAKIGESYYRIGDMQLKQKKISAAQNSFESSLDILEASNTNAALQYKALAYFGLADVMDSLGNTTDALDYRIEGKKAYDQSLEIHKL